MRNLKHKEEAQKFFERSVKGLFAQGKKSISSSLQRNCLYRGENGEKCGIGMCIDDSVYTSELDTSGLCVTDSKVCKALVDSGWTHEFYMDSIDFLDCIQYTHDKDYVEKWPSAFTIIGKFSGLDTDFINDLHLVVLEKPEEEYDEEFPFQSAGDS